MSHPVHWMEHCIDGPAVAGAIDNQSPSISWDFLRVTATAYDGITINTSKAQEGRRIRMRVMPIIADLVALQGVACFAAHFSNLFCSFCKLLRTEQLYRSSGVHSTYAQQGSEVWTSARTQRTNRVACAAAITDGPVDLHYYDQPDASQHMRAVCHLGRPSSWTIRPVSQYVNSKVTSQIFGAMCISMRSMQSAHD